jgi:histidinol-phosphatase (PHP family)
MTRGDYHVHTTYCDGKAKPEAMVRAALKAGLPAIGFTGHSHTAFDESWCMSPAGTAAYRAEIARLKAKFGGRIAVWCGVEQDLLSDASTDGYDYVIGSVHYLAVDGAYIPVDESAADLRAAAARHFGGDLYALAACYYEHVSRVWAVTGCGVIGHFDLITKFNEGGALFDESDPRYVAAWQSAADALLPTGALFEINTGAIARGCRTAPYPAAPILDYLASKGARFLLSGDAHSPGGLCFDFDRWAVWAAGHGAVLVDSPDFCIH